MNDRIAQLRREILERTRELISLREAPKPFIPGQTVVPYAGRVFDADEVEAGVASMLDFWLTLGPEGQAFEKELASLLGVSRTILVNSGSSANLVAMAALTRWPRIASMVSSSLSVLRNRSFISPVAPRK